MKLGSMAENLKGFIVPIVNLRITGLSLVGYMCYGISFLLYTVIISKFLTDPKWCGTDRNTDRCVFCIQRAVFLKRGNWRSNDHCWRYHYELEILKNHRI